MTESVRSCGERCRLSQLKGAEGRWHERELDVAPVVSR
jgi:hypothetical protein